MGRHLRSAVRPTNLHLAHSWGGGLGGWVSDFAQADPYSHNLVLESVGALACYGLELRLIDPGDGRVLDSWVLQHPISEMSTSHAEYAAIVASICSDYAIDHVYVSSLIGHSLEVFRLGLPITKIYHDYSAYCPALFIFRDGAVCTKCGSDELRWCRSQDIPHVPKSAPRYYLHFRDMFFERLAAADVRHVSPSSSLPRNLRRLDSRFEAIDFTVIEHGIKYDKRDLFGGAEEGRRLRVGIVGHLSWVKGLQKIREDFDVLRAIVDLEFIGCHDGGMEFARRWGAGYVHQYSPEELPAILDEKRLDLALFLSVVPETFSYTLSEAFCFCIPPVALPVGALVDRIEHGRDGFLLDLDGDPLVDFLLRIDRERDRLKKVAARLREKPVRTVADAVADYYRLRGEYTATLAEYLDAVPDLLAQKAPS